LFFNFPASGIPCVLKPFNSGLVCVCNSTYCDTLEYKNPPKAGDVVIISTSKDGLRFHETHAKFGSGKHLKIENGPYYFGTSSENRNDFDIQAQVMKVVKQIEGIEEPINAIVNIEVNRTEKFQEVIGFGGAFTGSVSYLLKLMSKELQDHIFKGYYSHEIGIGYNLMRYPIGGCDFDLAPWAYHEKPEHDPYLSNFTSLDERDIDKIAQIQDLKKASKNDDIRMIGTAWSPPKWMKTNNEWTGFSALRDEYYQTWANYHVKFLELMAKHDNNFWAITTGNEPMNGVLFQYFAKFMSLGWDPDSQGKWIANNLGPTMKASPVAKNVKILGGDDQRYTLPIWFERMHKGNENSTNFIDGLAFHWYADKMTPASLLNDAANIYPDKFIISTEACSGDRPWGRLILI
jgi:glucosylceramidase